MAKFILIFVGVAVAAVVIWQVIQPNTKPTSSLNTLLVTTTTAPSVSSTPTPIKSGPTATIKPSPPKSTTPTITSSQTTAYKAKVLIENVPFTPQAPFAEWSDSRFQEGCEEASSLMAIYWARNLSLDRLKARDEIIAMAAYQTEKWGEPRDTSANDTATRIIAGYFNYSNYEVKDNINLQDIKNELLKGNLVIVPTNGRALNNPHFTAPGPDRHMIVIRGYDDNTGTFITNDPGVKEGELYNYPQQLFFNAIRDYPTGFNLPIVGDKKIMIVIKKS